MSQNFWRGEDGTCFVSRSSAHIFHSTEIKKTSLSSAMSPVTQYINILTVTIHFFQKSQEFRRHFPIHSYVDIVIFGSATAPAYVQQEKLFTFLSSFSHLLSFSAFSPFSNIHLSAFSASSYIHTVLYVQLENLFSYQTVHLIKLFQPSYLNLNLSALSLLEKFRFFCKFYTIQPCSWMKTSV